ncbi:hypothetical protein L1049_026900 [Liquidambar formosana]|uniref:Thioredoxin domain-containing protein n=1 Tax=Liquidambar formosana TaxID=63359 RepID=A0AAP0NGC4_LIQFO
MAEEGQVISCHTIEAWEEQLQKGNGSGKLMVVDFTASWCGPCRFISPILAEFARRMTDVIFLKVDVDELKTVAEDWAVEAMPTFMFLKEGKIVDKVVGAKKEELQQTIMKHATAPSPAPAPAAAALATPVAAVAEPAPAADPAPAPAPAADPATANV